MECQILPRGDRKYFQLAHCQKIDVQSCFTVSRVARNAGKKKRSKYRRAKKYIFYNDTVTFSIWKEAVAKISAIEYLLTNTMNKSL